MMEVRNNDTIKKYYYDENLAKNSKAKNKLKYLLCIVGLMIFGTGLLIGVICVFVEREYNMLSILLISVMGIIVVSYFTRRVMLFVHASDYYFYKENGVVWRYFDTTEHVSLLKLSELIVYKETNEAYYCSYIGYNGKNERLIIPKYYLGIEEILF